MNPKRYNLLWEICQSTDNWELMEYRLRQENASDEEIHELFYPSEITLPPSLAEDTEYGGDSGTKFPVIDAVMKNRDKQSAKGHTGQPKLEPNDALRTTQGKHEDIESIEPISYESSISETQVPLSIGTFRPNTMGRTLSSPRHRKLRKGQYECLVCGHECRTYSAIHKHFQRKHLVRDLAPAIS